MAVLLNLSKEKKASRRGSYVTLPFRLSHGVFTLRTNCDKSSVYFSGVKLNVIQEILRLLGYNEGSLSFK
ncbi:hypothetical protein H5410_037924 [Solanum commersonii]|uniref:Uncharacterized protein n=1 Tax=Solanum commersonii TaxID=4109 RepID=A0A9J5YBM3_SOLCO|nr:hypothetical protein H5410_037924 [Solanum commersonii]